MSSLYFVITTLWLLPQKKKKKKSDYSVAKNSEISIKVIYKSKELNLKCL